MKISKKDARMWMAFFASLPEDEPLLPRQQEIALAAVAQIEAAADARAEALRREIPGLKSLEGRTDYVGPEAKFPPGCRSCLLGAGLSAVRKTNRCDARCRFCYDYGALDRVAPIGEGYWEIGGARFREEDVDLLLSILRRADRRLLRLPRAVHGNRGVLRRDRAVPRRGHPPAHVHQRHPRHRGKPARAGRGPGLDELRFNLGATGLFADRVIANMALAKKYLPRVGVETPMTPEFFDDLPAQEGGDPRHGSWTRSTAPSCT